MEYQTPLDLEHSNNNSYRDRALKILSENPLIDGHNDLMTQIKASYKNHIYFPNFTDPWEKGDFVGHLDLPRIEQGRYGGAFWSAFYPCPDDIFDFSTQNYDPSMLSYSFPFVARPS